MVLLALELGRNEGKELVYNVEVWKQKAIGRILTTSSEGQEDRKTYFAHQVKLKNVIDVRTRAIWLFFQHGGASLRRE